MTLNVHHLLNSVKHLCSTFIDFLGCFCASFFIVYALKNNRFDKDGQKFTNLDSEKMRQ